MSRLDSLPPLDERGNLRCIVEAPRGSTVKTKWDPSLEAFVLGRPLPLGMQYPRDWGFVPSTRAPDGDPLDVLVLHDASTWPGTVIPARLIGALTVTDRIADETRRNDRLIAVALDAVRYSALRDARRLEEKARAQLERFFLAITEDLPKEVRVRGWVGPKTARRILDETRT